MKAYNLENKSGNPVKNQIVVETKEGTSFFSYSREVVRLQHGKIFLDNGGYNYSTTTSKHVAAFLREFAGYDNAKDAIKKGGAVIVNLKEM